VRGSHRQVSVHRQRQLTGRQLQREPLVQPDECNLHQHSVIWTEVQLQPGMCAGKQTGERLQQVPAAVQLQAEVLERSPWHSPWQTSRPHMLGRPVHIPDS
jgi:hypothetical protein